MPKEAATRREFFKHAAAMTSAVALADQVLAGTAEPSASGLPTRVLGRTGERVSIMCLGGWHMASMEDKQDSTRLVHAAIDQGMTFMDNAWEYHKGRSEEWMGDALAMDGKRDQVFLMTKNCSRDYEGSLQHLEDSLRRLRTDRIDLWQFHELIYDNDPDWIFEKGALKAALEARKQGKVRYIGFTGHKSPHILRAMLDKPHEWDAAQMPINVLDAHYRSFAKELVPECLRREVGVIGMKGLGGGMNAGIIPSATGLSVEECWRYALSQPVASQVVGVNSLEQLETAVGIARAFQPMSDAEQEALRARVRDVAADGRHELFKSTQTFDGLVHRAQHGFPAPRR